jgi:glycosyltransferase involved in cell wall biosynthesis
LHPDAVLNAVEVYMAAAEKQSAEVTFLRQSPVKRQLLSIVVPVLNEEESITLFLGEIAHLKAALLQQFKLDCEVVFVDDGSTDNTRGVVQGVISSMGDANFVRLVGLSRNFGKEVALTAGLKAATGDLVVPMDVDLQDPPEIVLQMVDVWTKEGVCVVQAVRSDRSEDSPLKRYTANKFYGLMRCISSVKMESNAGDFQLLTRKAVQALLEYPEKNRFMKGLSASIGFKRARVFYKRPARAAGTTKFNGWKLWNFALDGITAFSTLPLRVWTYMGLMVAIGALGFATWTIVRTVIFGVVTPGYASMMTTMLFLGGVQLIGIGVVGEYVGRVASEVRNRPMYHVDLVDGFKEA